MRLAEFLCYRPLSNGSPLFWRLAAIANTYIDHLPLFRLCWKNRSCTQ
uniref:Uncharacterized protein n=1 Tax=Pseudomonas aeruginosa TaxID=287 RepID=G8CP04_PSEAI|nr:hypothetical protein [Pseudomonas aeruginosa]